MSHICGRLMDKSPSQPTTVHLDDRSSGAVAPVSVSWFRTEDASNCMARSPSDTRRHQPQVRKAFVTHSHAALAYCTEGSSLFEQNGRWQLSAGDVLLVPAGQPHRRVSSNAAAYWGLGVCVPCFARDDELQRVEPFERVRDGGGAVVRIPEVRRPFFEHLLRELAGTTNSQRQPHSAAIQRSLLLLILNEVSVVTRAQVAQSTHGSTLNAVVIESLRYIERNCLQRLTLQDVARAVGRTPAYVTTALSRGTGRSALEWIISGRMAEARRLLVHSSEPVGHVAERVGYSDVTHFIRLFRREHGKTPSAFRATQSSTSERC